MADWAGEWHNWGWVILGLILLCTELALPGIFLVWLGIAALATACVSFLFGSLLGWQAQAIIFLLFSVGAVLLSRLYFSRTHASDAPFLNQTIEELIGQSFLLEEPMRNRQGFVRINDTVWRIHGADLPKGCFVRILGYKNGALEVAEADPKA